MPILLSILALGLALPSGSNQDHSQSPKQCPVEIDSARRVVDSFLINPIFGDLRDELGYEGVSPSDVVPAFRSAVCEMILEDPRYPATDHRAPVIYHHAPTDRYILVVVDTRPPIVERDGYIDFNLSSSVVVFFDSDLGEEGSLIH